MSKLLARPCFVRRWAIATLKERGVSIPSSGTKNVDLARLLGIVPATKRALSSAYLCRDKKHEFAYDDSVKTNKASYISTKIKNDDALVPVGSDAFLRTYEWRRLRMSALKLHGAKCQCCGASSRTGAIMNVDHIKPRKLFPDLALSLDNLQVLCHECNHGKGNWDVTDWRSKADPLEVHIAELLVNPGRLDELRRKVTLRDGSAYDSLWLNLCEALNDNPTMTTAALIQAMDDKEQFKLAGIMARSMDI